MKINESDLLTIHFEKETNCFVQFWKTSPKTFEDLKMEFLIFTSFYKKYKPTNTLWLQENFCLPLNVDINNWIEEHVNVPCVENGNRKVAFVVGKDVLVHLSVMNSFKETKSIISPLREKEILVIFSKGMRHQEVADELFISVQTLRTHWKNIKNKLEIKSIADVIMYVNSFDME